jgi:hypothetical protein
MLHKSDDTTLKISLTKDTFTEIQILAIRKGVHPREAISEILDQYINKRKDKITNVT